MVDPAHGLARELSETAYACEAKGALRGCARPRVAKPLEAYSEAMADVNELLTARGRPPLGSLELLAARLYTGPMYTKYAAVLRGLGSSDPVGHAVSILRHFRPPPAPTPIGASRSCDTSG